MSRLSGTRVAPGLDWWLAALVVLALVVRAALFWQCGPVPMGDTGGYELLASSILSGDWSTYTGSRTPLYAILLILCRFDYGAVWLAQAGLGIATTVVLYEVVRGLSCGRPAAFAAGLIFSLSINQLMFERAILTEALCTFLLALLAFQALGGYLAGLSWRRDIVLGLILGLLSLAHPRFNFLILSFPVCFMLSPPPQSSRLSALKRSFVVLSAAMTLTLLWSAVNLWTVGVFAPSTTGSSSLMGHVAPFIEEAPAEFDDMKRVLIAVREKLRAEHGDDAVPFLYGHAAGELRRANGGALSVMHSRLTSMCWQLIAANPDRYLASVARSFVTFWQPVRVPYQGFFDRDFRDSNVAQAVVAIWKIEDDLWRLGYLCFFLAALHALVRRGSPACACPRFIVLVAWLLLFYALVQAPFAGADNQRFAVAWQPLVLAGDAWLAAGVAAALAGRARRQPLREMKPS